MPWDGIIPDTAPRHSFDKFNIPQILTKVNGETHSFIIFGRSAHIFGLIFVLDDEIFLAFQAKVTKRLNDIWRYFQGFCALHTIYSSIDMYNSSDIPST